MKISETIHDLFEINSSSKCKLITFVNPFSYYIFADSGIRSYFDYIFIDGFSLVKIYNLLNNRNAKRYSFDFTSLASNFFKFASDNKLKIALVGSTKNEIEAASLVIKSRFPELSIAFIHDGYFSEEDTQNIVSQMNKLTVDVVICGMGTPRQEKFLVNCKKGVRSLKYGFTCGGFFTQIASNEDYFHPFFDRYELRWLQRFYRHSFVRKRMLVDYPIFFVRYLWGFFRK